MKKSIIIFISILIVGSISSCKKEILAPTVTTKEATEIQYQTATLNGSTDNGGGVISERGFIYSTAQGVTIGGSGVNQVKAGSGDGDFSAEIIQLSPNTTYYFKAYSTNETATVEGSEKSFSTL